MFIYIVNICLLYCFYASSAGVDIKTYYITKNVEHYDNKESEVDFKIEIINDEPTNTTFNISSTFNISFYASQSSRHVYFENTTFKRCYMGGLQVDVIERQKEIHGSVKLMFPSTECCKMATSLCAVLNPADDPVYDEYCVAYADVQDNESAGFKHCSDGIHIAYIISICVVCGIFVIILLLLIGYVCFCRRSKINRKNEPDINPAPLDLEQTRVSIDLKRKEYTSFADSTDIGLPAQTNLPNFESFFFGSCSSVPQTEERLPQEFLSGLMKKYVEFVAEWNKAMPASETPSPHTLSELGLASNKIATPPKPNYKETKRQRRISIKRRKEKGMSAVYVNQWDSTMEIPRGNLELKEKVGEGQFGDVHKAILRIRNTETTVAVKKLKDGTTKDARNNFLRELATHALLEDHPHVIKLVGCCIEREPMLVIFEYMANGSLLDYLKERPEKVSSALYYVVKFGHHIAQGMAFLAATEIIHRDLAARNILINQSGICKIADFGFAKDVFGVTKYTKKLQTAPIRWMAPESLLDGVFSTQSDVWSFGVLLWEIVTLGREVPYFDVRSVSIKTKIKEGLRLRRPGHCPSDLYALMDICWKENPEDRPTFERLCKEFEDLEHLGHYTVDKTSHARKPSKLRGLVNRITRQLSNGEPLGSQNN